MHKKILVKEVPIEEALKVNSTIIEFSKTFSKNHFEERCKDKEKLVIAAYIDNQPVGYIVGYDRYNDGSFYCWMAGVNPKFRKKGMLKALMEYEDDWARKKGYNKIKIKTRNSRREMLSYLVRNDFYFIEIDSRADIRETRMLLEKEL